MIVNIFEEYYLINKVFTVSFDNASQIHELILTFWTGRSNTLDNFQS